ncbi:MAG: hypothetical protein ACKO3N_08860, partial [Verrucomicrobiota bacterium]
MRRRLSPASGMLLWLAGWARLAGAAVGPEVVPVAPSAHPGPRLQRLSPEITGIRFTNRVSLPQALENNNLLNGAGLALGDVNG